MQKNVFRVCVLLASIAVVWWLISKGALDVLMCLLMTALFFIGLWYIVKWFS